MTYLGIALIWLFVIVLVLVIHRAYKRNQEIDRLREELQQRWERGEDRWPPRERM